MTYRKAIFQDIISSPTTSIQSGLENNSGQTISQFAPVRIDTNGDMAAIDVSVEAEALATAGVAVQSVSNTESGAIAYGGKIENVSLGNFGDIMYVSKTGGLTSTKPSEGVDSFVAGDWVIRIGVIAKNESNPANKDLLLSIVVVGQL